MKRSLTWEGKGSFINDVIFIFFFQPKTFGSRWRRWTTPGLDAPSSPTRARSTCPEDSAPTRTSSRPRRSSIRVTIFFCLKRSLESPFFILFWFRIKIDAEFMIHCNQWLILSPLVWPLQYVQNIWSKGEKRKNLRILKNLFCFFVPKIDFFGFLNILIEDSRLQPTLPMH